MQAAAACWSITLLPLMIHSVSLQQHRHPLQAPAISLLNKLTPEIRLVALTLSGK